MNANREKLAVRHVVAYRRHALLAAWHVVDAQARESWTGYFCRLLWQLAPAVSSGTPVYVLCHQGLGGPDLWCRLTAPGWLRPTSPSGRPAGSGHAPGGAGAAFGRAPWPGTLVVLHHARGREEPRLLLTDTPPTQTDGDLYVCCHWIEQGFRDPGGAAGRGTARAGGIPCAWPGTCWRWPWPSCSRRPQVPPAA